MYLLEPIFSLFMKIGKWHRSDIK